MISMNANINRVIFLMCFRHGVGRTDLTLFADQTLKFKSILDSLASDLKIRKDEGKNKQANAKPDIVAAPSLNSTAPDSETTSIAETPSTGIKTDRQPVATHNDKKQTNPEDNGDFSNSISNEAAEILSGWPKVGLQSYN